MKRNLLILLLIFIGQLSYSQDAAYDQLSTYFEEYRLEAQKESSKLWGISFDIPLMVVFPDSNVMVLNQASEGFRKYKDLYIGKSDEIRAGGQSSKKWRNESWGFYTYPLPENKEKRLELFFHEAFHRNQPALKLEGYWAQCKYLVESDARILLKLEFNALFKALEEEDFKQYLTDALCFRLLRYHKYPNAYNKELSMEMAEGLAQYTGFKLSNKTIEDALQFFKSKDITGSHTFAYSTGLAYCYVLDKSGKDWRSHITQNDNFLYFTQKMLQLDLPENIEKHVEQVKGKYNWDDISKEEIEISKQQQIQEEKYLSDFFENPVVKIDLSVCKNLSLNTTIIYPLKDGKVYNGITAFGDWGKLISKDEMFYGEVLLLLPTPFKQNGRKVEGNGWEITLNEGWMIEEDAEYNFVLKRDSINKL